jgi:hypothetical protein
MNFTRIFTIPWTKLADSQILILHMLGFKNFQPFFVLFVSVSHAVDVLFCLFVDIVSIPIPLDLFPSLSLSATVTLSFWCK